MELNKKKQKNSNIIMLCILIENYINKVRTI